MAHSCSRCHKDTLYTLSRPWYGATALLFIAQISHLRPSPLFPITPQSQTSQTTYEYPLQTKYVHKKSAGPVFTNPKSSGGPTLAALFYAKSSELWESSSAVSDGRQPQGNLLRQHRKSRFQKRTGSLWQNGDDDSILPSD